MEKADRSDPRHVLTPEGCQSVHPDDVEIAGGSRGWEHQPYGPVGLLCGRPLRVPGMVWTESGRALRP